MTEIQKKSKIYLKVKNNKITVNNFSDRIVCLWSGG